MFLFFVVVIFLVVVAILLVVAAILPALYHLSKFRGMKSWPHLNFEKAHHIELLTEKYQFKQNCVANRYPSIRKSDMTGIIFERE